MTTSVVRDVPSRLALLEGRVPPGLRDEVQAIRRLLSDPEREWIGPAEARRLLDVQSVEVVKGWARLGVLRSRRGEHGRSLVYVEDVLRQPRRGAISLRWVGAMRR